MAGSTQAQTAQTGYYDHPHESPPASSSKGEVAVQVEGDEEDEANEQEPEQQPVKPWSPSSAPRQPVSLLDLPTELLQLIISYAEDFLSYYGPRRHTFTHLCSVCRTLLAITRPFLYKRIDFHFARQGEQYLQSPKSASLNLTLATLPHVASLVQEVSLARHDDLTYLEQQWGVEVPWIDEDHEDEVWLRRFAALHAVDFESRIAGLFSAVKNVTKLSVWVEYDVSDFSSVLSTVVLPSVKSLSILSFSPNLALALPELVNLKCDSIELPHGQVLPAAPSLQTLNIPHNHHNGGSPDLEWITSILVVGPSRGASYRPNLGLVHLDQTFFAGLSAPSVLRLVLNEMHFSTPVYLQLLGNRVHLPNLEILDLRRIQVLYGDKRWIEAERALVEACERRAVRILLPRAPKQVRRRTQ
ncbi:hypothetical protein JCM8097_003039 [Rhodosporidiobolus ruineniae]